MPKGAGWRVGDKVRARDWVRPKRFAGKLGVVAEVRHVAPGKVELGVGHPAVWFLPEELEPAPSGTHVPGSGRAARASRRPVQPRSPDLEG